MRGIFFKRNRCKINSRCIFLWRNNLGIYTGSVMSLMQIKKASKSHTILSKHSSYYLVIFLFEFLQ